MPLPDAIQAGTMKPTTIQATAKRFKAIIVLSVLAIIVGLIWTIFATVAGEPTGTPLVVMSGAVFTYFLARFCAWWENG